MQRAKPLVYVESRKRTPEGCEDLKLAPIVRFGRAVHFNLDGSASMETTGLAPILPEAPEVGGCDENPEDDAVVDEDVS